MTVDTAQAANRRTLLLVAGFVALVGLIAWPSFVGRMQYARTRAEIAAIRDAASGAELSAVGKLFTTLPRLIGPAVVNVTSQRRVVLVADEIAALRGFTPAGVTDEAVGSGVIIEKDGVIVTNYHVVANSDEIDVTLADGRRFQARLVGADPASDLAVLRIDTNDLPTAIWGDSGRRRSSSLSESPSTATERGRAEARQGGKVRWSGGREPADSSHPLTTD